MISLLLINYRSAALAKEAVRTARASVDQVVAVDNSLDPREAEQLRSFCDVVLESKTNRGYAGGINDGRKHCDGDILVITNPDVSFAPDAIAHLANALDDRTAISGPALFWDDAHTWMLPPADRNTGLQKLDEVFASRSRIWFEQRDKRRIAQRLAFWSVTETTRVDALSGAVMAVRAKDFDDNGGFDERFRLYFEETDFQRRLRKRLAYVPAAKVRHLFNQSAGQQSAESAALYAQSELRYLEKWNGPFAARLLKRLERPMPPFELRAKGEARDILIEASPLPSFVTAAGHFPSPVTCHPSPVASIPTEVLQNYKVAALYLRSIDRNTLTVQDLITIPVA